MDVDDGDDVADDETVDWQTAQKAHS